METWTTADLPEYERFSYWKEVLCKAYVALDSTQASDGAFVGTVKAHPLSTINITTISSTRQTISRGRSEISQVPAEYYFLNLQVKGQCRMMQGRREALLQPGDFAIVDSTEPYVNDYCSDDWIQHSFRIPQHMLRPRLRNPITATALRVDGSLGVNKVVVDYLTSVAMHMDQFSQDASGFGNSLIDLVAMSVGATEHALECGGTSVRRALYDSILKFIAMNAGDPELCPGKVALHFHMSTRYLHKVLEEGGRSFGHILLNERLERCAADLRSGHGRNISDVALRWGFNDLSHFSRTFRQRFSVTPKEYRLEHASKQHEGLVFALA